MEDSGIFAAVIENRGGSAKCSANLVVQERSRREGAVPPSFLTTIQGTVVKAGQLARFDARVSATKPVDVYWLKVNYDDCLCHRCCFTMETVIELLGLLQNKKKITPDIRYKMVEEDNLYTLLIIETVPEDSGTYECVAINNFGEARCEGECLVQPTSAPTKGKTETSQQQQAPGIVEPLKGLIIKEGQPAVFKCKISGKAREYYQVCY